MALHHNSASLASAWAPTGGLEYPLPQKWEQPSWSQFSHQKQVIWAERGRKGGGRDEGKTHDIRWHQGVSLLCSKQEHPLYTQPTSSNHSDWETAHDWPAASVYSEMTDYLPVGGKKQSFLHILFMMYSSIKALAVWLYIQSSANQKEFLLRQIYPVILGQVDVWEQALIVAQCMKLAAHFCYIHQQVTHWNIAEDAEQDLVR